MKQSSMAFGFEWMKVCLTGSRGFAEKVKGVVFREFRDDWFHKCVLAVIEKLELLQSAYGPQLFYFLFFDLKTKQQM